jgi:hypothetical protein
MMSTVFLSMIYIYIYTILHISDTDTYIWIVVNSDGELRIGDGDNDPHKMTMIDKALPHAPCMPACCRGDVWERHMHTNIMAQTINKWAIDVKFNKSLLYVVRYALWWLLSVTCTLCITCTLIVIVVITIYVDKRSC